MKYQAAAEVVATEFRAGLQQPRRRLIFIAIDLGVALVAGDDEVVFVGECEELLQGCDVCDSAGRIAGRADIEQLTASPDRSRDCVVIRREPGGGGAEI